MLVKRREKGLQTLVTNQTRSGVKFSSRERKHGQLASHRNGAGGWELCCQSPRQPPAVDKQSAQRRLTSHAIVSALLITARKTGSQWILLFYSSHAESLVATLRMPTVWYFHPITVLYRNFFYPNTAAPWNIFHVAAHKDMHYRDVSCIRKSCS
jgi:hypothetical protein